MVLSSWTKHALAVQISKEMCKHCKNPKEYCEFAQCVESFAKKTSELKVEGSDEAKEETKEEETKEEETGKEEKQKPGKKKKEKKKQIVITLTSRNKRKMITNVSGFEHFKEKFGDPQQMKDLSKALGKKFACGCSITKGATLQDEVDLQGEFGDQVGEILVEKYGFKEDDVVVVDKSKK